MFRLLMFSFLLALLLLPACSIKPKNSPVDSLPNQAREVESILAAPTKAAGALLATIDNSISPALSVSSPSPTQAPVANLTPLHSPTPVPTVKPTLSPDGWKALPIIPEISPTVIEIYQRGVRLGNNPGAFSKIGDCGSTPAWFLGDFDRGEKYYRLGETQYLDEVIQAYQGSYSRTSLAAKSGFNASSIFSSLWTNREFCEANETPLACEYRVNKPVIAFIMLGTNDVYHPDDFEPQMRKIIEYSIDQGVIPVLSTKADNIEGDGSINATIARLAMEYDVPLWNYWRAIQELPEQGLQEDGVHLTWGPNRFDDPLVMTRAWPVRNLNALQTLDVIWRLVQRSK